MSLDELSLDSGEGVGEAPSEKSEKQREQSRKAQAQLQKTQKDEKKAKTDNEELFVLLSRFIQNPLYDDLVATVVLLLQHEYPSRFLLSLIALVYPEASVYLLQNTGYKEKIDTLSGLFHSPEKITFDDATLHPSLREWITLWLTATEGFLLSENASMILKQKLLHLLSKDEQKIAENSVATFFQFFFLLRKIEISQEKSKAYASYIISQMKQTLQVRAHLDDDLFLNQTIDAKDLFGV